MKEEKLYGLVVEETGRVVYLNPRWVARVEDDQKEEGVVLVTFSNRDFLRVAGHACNVADVLSGALT